LAKKFGHLGLDHLRQDIARTAQDFCELIPQGPWFNQLDDVIRSTRHIHSFGGDVSSSSNP